MRLHSLLAIGFSFLCEIPAIAEAAVTVQSSYLSTIEDKNYFVAEFRRIDAATLSYQVSPDLISWGTPGTNGRPPVVETVPPENNLLSIVRVDRPVTESGTHFLRAIASTPDTNPPTHSHLAILGTAPVKQVWNDNDGMGYIGDGYLEDLMIASHLNGTSILRGRSATTSTDVDGYNQFVQHDIALQFGIDGDAMLGEMAEAGWDTSRIPKVGQTFRGQMTKPASGLIQDTARVFHPKAQLLVDAANAHASPGNPLIVCCGGPLTLVADAYLLDPTIVDKVVVSFLASYPQGGRQASYNEWADGWGAQIVYEKFNVVAFTFFNPYFRDVCPVVPKTRILADFPAGKYRDNLHQRDHDGFIPGNHDPDGACFALVIDPNYITNVVRCSVIGSIVDSSGGTVPGHEIPNFAQNATGNIWVVNTVNQASASNAWWAEMDRPGLWSE